MARRRFETRLFPSVGALPALGGIKVAGTIRVGVGAGRPRKRDLGSYALIYLVGGSGTFEDGAGIRPIRAGDLLWVFPGIPHAYGPAPGGRWDEIYLVFEGPLPDLWRRQGVLDPARPVWRLGPVGFWLDRIEAVARTGSARGWESSFLQISRLQSLVADMRLAVQDDGGVEGGWLEEACHRLAAADASSAPAAVARAIGMSYETFRKNFARRMGSPPARYRQARRIDRACLLLLQGSLSHRRIAERLGFCDEFHFSKAFRRQTGFSPQAFRLRALAPAPMAG